VHEQWLLSRLSAVLYLISLTKEKVYLSYT